MLEACQATHERAPRSHREDGFHSKGDTRNRTRSRWLPPRPAAAPTVGAKKRVLISERTSATLASGTEPGGASPTRNGSIRRDGVRRHDGRHARQDARRGPFRVGENVVSVAADRPPADQPW